MPIIWKLQFEEPLIRQLQSGTIGNSKQLVRAIVLQYDLCIKQGLAAPPATPAGPFISGKPFALQRALSTFFKLKSVKDKALLVTIYAGLLKSIYSKIRENSREAVEIKKQLASSLSEQRRIQSKLNGLSSSTDIVDKKQVKQLQTQLNSTKLVRVQGLAKLNGLKSDLRSNITPKLGEVRKQLQSLLVRVSYPPLQDTTIKSYKTLPKKLKDLVKDLKDKKTELQTDIRDNFNKINEAGKTVRQVSNNIAGPEAAAVKSNINKVIKSTNLNESTKASNKIMGILDSYPENKIPTELKNNCRDSLNKILESKSIIESKKSEIKEILSVKLKERRDDLIKSFKPKFVPGPTKIQELLEDRKQLKNVVKEVRDTVNQYKETIKVSQIVKTEYKKTSRLLASRATTYVPNTELVSTLNSKFNGAGDKYKNIKTPKEAKVFMLVLLVQILGDIGILKAKILKVKTEYVKEYKDLLLRKKFNIEERVFNALLKIGLVGYWSGGVWGIGTIANVVFPGTAPLPVQLRSSANPANFIRSLSKAFQAHLKTVTGIYTIPGSPPVVLPWATYS